MIPFYKLFSLFIRVFSRPVINYVKKLHITNPNSQDNSVLRIVFLKTGNFYHRLEFIINRKFLKVESEFAHKPLNDQLAVQKGIQFIYQLVFYSLVIGLPIYQMIRGQIQAEQKKQQMEKRLAYLQQTIEEINLKYTQLLKVQQEKKKNRQLQQLVNRNIFMKWLTKSDYSFLIKLWNPVKLLNIGIFTWDNFKLLIPVIQLGYNPQQNYLNLSLRYKKYKAGYLL